ncbi:protein phosphatase 2C domain-containing protein [Streptomyces sp. Je 1-332]|uniref:protein phosphatase 2C domain-containing protein n=1 Tax=Streptomyces sp. Je 1-332 TaxID=3231270 RepID=UPI003459791E
MSQQGERHDGASGQEDDWWGQLYDDSAHDTGPAEAADTLDDRFASAVSASAGEGVVVAAPEDEGEGEGAHGAPPRPGRFPAPEPPPPGFQDRRSAFDSAPGLAPRPPDSAPPREPSPPPSPAAPPPSPAAPPPPSYDPPPPAAPVRQDVAPWESTAAPTGPVTFPARPSKQPGDPSRTTAVPGPRAPEESAVPEPQALAPVEPQASAPPESRAPAPADAGPAVVAAAPVDAVSYVGDGPPTYDAEPTVLPTADPDDLGDLVADTVLDGARYGNSTLRAVSVRGDSARYRGEPRRDSLLTARFGTGERALVLVAMATGARATPGAHRAAAEACAWIGRAVGRSHQRLSEDIRAARRGDLKSGLHRLTDRSLGKLRAHAADLGIEPEEYAASLRCLLLPADPECRTRVFFGVGGGGLFRLRDGAWQDIEPHVSDSAGDAGPPVVGFGSMPPQTPDGDRLTMDMGIITPPSPYEPAPEPPPREPFRFRASVARPGDALMLCSGGLAEPLRGEPELAAHLTQRWAKSGPPGLATFLADIQVRVKGYADDRTAAAVWEA